MITDALIRKATGQYDPETVQRLSLDNMSIKRISNLDRCSSSLLELSLQSNEITDIGGLSQLSLLQRLDLSNNKIKKIGNYFFIMFFGIKMYYFYLYSC